MKLLRPILVALVAIALLAAFFLVVRIPSDEVGVVDTGRVGAAHATLQTGIHLRPFGSTVITYSTAPATASGETIVTPASGGEIPIRYSVTGRIDPERAAELHPALGGATIERFLSEQTGRLVSEYASSAEAVEILTSRFREKAAADIAARMKNGGLAEASLTIQPPDGDTLLAAAQYLAPLGEAWKIRQTCAEALAEPDAGRDWRLLAAMGLVNESEKRFAEAEKNYLDALALDPRALTPMSQLVPLYASVKEWNKLARILDAALQADPNSLQHINWMAMVMLKRQDYPAAEELLRRALSVDSANTTVLANLGALHMKMNRVDEAIKNFEKAVELAPTNSQALFNLGSALAATDRFAEALAYLERAEQEGATPQPLVRTLALVHLKLGNREKAAAYKEKEKQLEAEESEAKKKAAGDGRSEAGS